MLKTQIYKLLDVIYKVQLSVCVIVGEIFINFGFWKHSTMSPFMSAVWVVWELTPWRFKYWWAVALTNSVPLSDCIVIYPLFWNNGFKAADIEETVLSFRVTLQA